MEGEFVSVSTPELMKQITTLAGHLNEGNARFLALIAEFDRRNSWAEWGVKSYAHWLNWKCGIGLGAAREKLRVARALVALPGVAAHDAEDVRITPTTALSLRRGEALDLDIAVSSLMERRAKNVSAEGIIPFAYV